MNKLNKKTKILFSIAHQEYFVAKKGEAPFSDLYDLLEEKGFEISYTKEPLTTKNLKNVQILIIGSPRNDLDEETENTEIEIIKEFVSNGGGLFLVSDGETMINAPEILNKLAAIANIEFQEYLNYPPTYFQVFLPHYVTANIKKLKIGKIACLNIESNAKTLALTKATKQEVVACANIEKGRLIAFGDTSSFNNDLLNEENNKRIVINIFNWLAHRNAIDIENISIPKEAKWGQKVPVTIQLRNESNKNRLEIECKMESDADALFDEPIKKSRSIPPDEITQMQWYLKPQILGEQKLRLRLDIQGHEVLYFDQLPEMNCLAPGYFTLEIKDRDGKQKTDYKTGEQFSVHCSFHWTGEIEHNNYKLDLKIDDGLINRGYEKGIGIDQWTLQAISEGTQKIEIFLTETGQSLLALINVKSSEEDKVTEIYTAYVYPLDAEIFERLRIIEEEFRNPVIKNQPFEISSPENFVDNVYKGDAAGWLKGVIKAARREQWYNLDLLDLVLTYIAPTYLPNYGSFIPYDPNLASHLAELHPINKRDLEYNFLCSLNSEDINIKQNIAAYLLHEKYGHGFFYTQTKLGIQLAILHRHGFPDGAVDKKFESYIIIAKHIEDSAIIINEGFAAWMELTFLNKLDHEARQAIYQRENVLLHEATGLYEKERQGGYFEAFPPKFDSRYREGCECLQILNQYFNERCGIRIMIIATNIDFGISENENGDIKFKYTAEMMEELLFNKEKDDFRSSFRLYKIAELLNENIDVIQKLLKVNLCPLECTKNKCPIENFIYEKLNWRQYE